MTDENVWVSLILLIFLIIVSMVYFGTKYLCCGN